MSHYTLAKWRPECRCIIMINAWILMMPILPALVFSSVSTSSAGFSVKSTIKIWTQMRHFRWLSFSLKSPIHSNHIFKPYLLDKTFIDWQKIGIKYVIDLSSDGVFSSFEQLCSKFSLSGRYFFRYLQVQDFVHKTLPQFLPYLQATHVMHS